MRTYREDRTPEGKLRNQLRGHFQDIQKLCAGTHRHYLPSCLANGEERYRFILKVDPTKEQNPVLTYCLARYDGFDDIATEIENSALEVYLEQPNAYRTVLKHFLPDDFLQKAQPHLEQIHYDAGNNSTASADWTEFQRRLESQRNEPIVGLPSGFPTLDKHTGGLRGLTFLGGDCGLGKTALATHIGLKVLKNNPNMGLLFYSLDMSKTTLYYRLLCHTMEMPLSDLMAIEDGSPESERLAKTHEQLENLLSRLCVIEAGELKNSNDPYQSVIDRLNQCYSEMNVRQILTVFYYFQLIPIPSPSNNPVEVDNDRVKILKRIQNWTQTSDWPLGDPILVVSEVRKGESNRTELNIADLMGSSRIGYSADVILLLEPGRQSAPSESEVALNLNVAKCRDGITRARIPLVFDIGTYRIREADSPQKVRKSPSKASVASDGVDPLGDG